MESLTALLEIYLPPAECEAVNHAAQFSAEAHKGQYRKTGEPYVSHPISVAKLLTEMRMDSASIQAALLHDVIEDTDYSAQDIIDEFGEEVGALVDGVTKITQVDFATREAAQAAYFRKMIMAMSDDIRVILIKLADRLHNMRTLQHMPRAKQCQIARETLDIYAPIANRLGMHKFRLELEDLGFAALYPMRYRILNEAVRKTRGNRSDLVNKIEQTLIERLDHEQINYRIQGREKNLYSLYAKMKRNRVSFEEVFDLFALRVVVDKVDTCYRALGVVHNTFKPVAKKFKDYIAIPKSNGYQSLHTSTVSSYGVPVEVQIRTEEMDMVANDGIASHWLYKSDSDSRSGHSHQRAREWLTGILELQQQTGDAEDFIEHVKIDLFPNEVFVFTPQGEIMELPAGATAIDFAYAVHSDIGNHCVAVRIEGKLAPLSTKLQSGSKIEVITSTVASPNPLWLNFVVTSKARAGIRHVLKNLSHEQAIKLGQRLLRQQLIKFGIELEDISTQQIEEALPSLQAETYELLLADIGLGNRMALVAAQRLADPSKGQPTPRVDGLRGALARITPWLKAQNSPTPVSLSGGEGIVVSYARCCRPIPGDPVHGFVTAGRGIVVHLDKCPNIAELRNQTERWVDVAWDSTSDRQYPVDIRVVTVNRRGALAAIASTIAAAGANIDTVTTETHDGYNSVTNLTIEVNDRHHLAQLMRSLKAHKEVIRITRKRG